MIETVSLKNWRSHGEKNGSYGTVVEFREGLNVIYGINGSGKSSIAEAIAYGLFGIAPQGLKEVLRVGAKKGSVRVLFKVDGLYEVRREFGESGTLDVELFRLEDGRKIPLVLGRSRDVERKIEEILGVSKRLYQQILYASQNALSEIFERSPSERTRELDKILGLEELRKARDLLSTIRNALAREIKSYNLVELEREKERHSKRLADLEREVRSLEGRLSNLEELLSSQSKRLKEVESSLKEAEEKVNALQELRRKKDGLEGELKALKSSLKHPDADEEDEAKFEQLKEKHRKLESLKERLESLRSKASLLRDQLSKLEEVTQRPDVEGLKKAIKEKELEAEQLEQSLNELLNRESSLSKEETSLQEKMRSLEKSKKEMENLSRRRDEILRILAEESDKIRERLAELRERLGSLEGEKALLEGISEDLLSKGKCPVCGTLLSPEDVRRIVQGSSQKKKLLEEEIKRLKGELSSLEKRQEYLSQMAGTLKTINDRIESLSRELSEMEELKRRLEETSRELASLREEISKGRQRLNGIRSELDRLRNRLLEENRRLQIFLQRKDMLSKLESVEKELKEVERTFMSELSPFSDLEYLEREVERFKERAESWRLKVRVAEVEKQLEDVIKSMEPLQGAEEEYKKLSDLYAELRTKVSTTEKDLEGTRILLTTKKEMLKEVELSLKSVEEKLDRYTKLERGLNLIETLLSGWEEAFRRVRDARVEKINEAVNLVWRRLYTNLYADYDELRLRVDESRKGYSYFFLARMNTPKGAVWRDISTLSGGERTAAILAFRLALAYLLSGGFLILDEPTHNLDERLTEGLASFLKQAVEDDALFNQVIVITHDPIFADYADVVYEVRRKKEGNDPAQVVRVR